MQQMQHIETTLAPEVVPDIAPVVSRALTTTEQAALLSETVATQTLPTEPPKRDLVGALVFYVLPDGYSAGQRRPAEVVRDNGGDKVNLTVTTDWLNDYPTGAPGSDGKLWKTSIDYAPAASHTPNSWHWRSEGF